jgi:alkylhydroperoxidase family enzyme
MLDGVEESWQVAIRYAEQVTESGRSVSDAVYRRLAEYWDEGQLVEITLVVGLFAYFNRFNDALPVEVTR